MPGANYLLSKGFLATGGSVAYNEGELVKLVAGSTLQPAQVELCDTQGEAILGVLQETLDAEKVATGKAYVGVQLMGIARCRAGGAITLDALVTAGADARVEAAASTHVPFGRALETAADGDYFHVLLMPYLPALA